MRRSSLARIAIAAIVALAALSARTIDAAAAPGSTCTAAEKQRRQAALIAARRRAPAQRRAFFRRHASPRERRAFVAAQRARLRKLKRAAGCVVPRVDVALELSGPGGTITWGSETTLQLLVRNAGTAWAEATATFEVEGATVVTAPGCVIGLVTLCEFRSLTPGASATVPIVVRAARRGRATARVVLDVFAATPDVDSRNDAASAFFDVVLPPRIADRPDDASGPQVHFLYVVPLDGADRRLDETGAVANSVAAFQRWLAGQTGGRTLRADTSGGRLDVTFFRLGRTDAEVAANGTYVLNAIVRELEDAAVFEPSKIYGIYYDGTSTTSCGGASWPPTVPGVAGAIYLRGTPPGSPACGTNQLAAAGAEPGYFDFAMLHELVHTLGFVAECAPHHGRAGHVVDDPSDLMYGGDLPWYPSALDVGHDDYYGHSAGGCPDLADSPYLD